MNFKELKLKLKNELKTIAVEIHNFKKERKQRKFGYVPELYRKQLDFRIQHIALCLLRGVAYDKIESKHRDRSDTIHKYCKNQADKLVMI